VLGGATNETGRHSPISQLPRPERRAHSDRRIFLFRVPVGAGVFLKICEKDWAQGPRLLDAVVACNNGRFGGITYLGREGKMPARPSWQGHLRLSLVTCPVALYPGTIEAETVPHQDADPGRRHRRAGQPFNLINPETNNLVKGYQIAKSEYVILSKEDFESVKLESTHTLDIEKFVPRESINRLY
jgi:Ku70/Ku80-like protein